MKAVMRTLVHYVAVLAIAAVVAVTQTGCVGVPIQNVKDAAVVTSSGKTLSADQVRAAIIRAGAGLGWQITEEAPGKLVGTLVLRTHTAVVDIFYTATTYSIQYRSSINLDESGGQIHKNYNGWISNLVKGINTQTALS
jgi:hypothetical protein